MRILFIGAEQHLTLTFPPFLSASNVSLGGKGKEKKRERGGRCEEEGKGEKKRQ